MFVRTANGVVDVGSDIALNSQASVLFAAQFDNVGNQVNEFAPPVAMNLSVRPLPIMGQYIKVPDQSMKLIREISPTEPDRLVWTLPDGSQLFPTFAEVKFSISSWNIPFSRTVNLTEVSVKLTQGTIRGLVAVGAISQRDAEILVPSLPPTPTDDPRAGVASGLRSVAIIAIVGAMIWFLPKDILR